MKKIKYMAIIGALCLALYGCGNNTSEKSAVSDNGNYIFGQVDSISGNDVTLLLANYVESDNDTDDEKSKPTSSDSDDNNDKPDRNKFSGGDFNGERPDMSKFKDGDFDGEKPDMSKFKDGDFNGEKPDMSKFKDGDFNGEKPDMSKFKDGDFDGEKPDMSKFKDGDFDGEKPDMSKFNGGDFNGEKPDTSKFSGGKPSRKSSSSNYQLTGDEELVRIPVGTKVTTKLGVETDFEVLKAGDIIKCEIEQDSNGTQVVTAVWIVE